MEIEKSNILVLGGEGFLGRNIIDVLSGDYSCFSLSRSKSIFSSDNYTFMPLDPYHEKIPGKYDVVVHLIDNKCSLEDVKKNEQNLLANLKDTGFRQIVYLSSSILYSDPNSEYGQRKKICESVYSSFCEEKKIGLSVLRLFNTYGFYQLPNRKGSLVATILVNHILQRETTITDKKAKRDFIFSRDIAKIIKKIIDEEINTVDDLAFNTQTTIEGLISIIEKSVVNSNLKINYLNNEEKVICPAANSHLVKKISLTPLVSALTETYNFYLKNIDLIKVDHGKE